MLKFMETTTYENGQKCISLLCSWTSKGFVIVKQRVVVLKNMQKKCLSHWKTFVLLCANINDRESALIAKNGERMYAYIGTLIQQLLTWQFKGKY